MLEHGAGIARRGDLLETELRERLLNWATLDSFTVDTGLYVPFLLCLKLVALRTIGKSTNDRFDLIFIGFRVQVGATGIDPALLLGTRS